MGKRLTKRQLFVVTEMYYQTRTSSWYRIPSPTDETIVAHAEVRPTRSHDDRLPDTYTDLIQLKLALTSGVVLTHAPSPWSAPVERMIPYWLALVILSNPSVGRSRALERQVRAARRETRRARR